MILLIIVALVFTAMFYWQYKVEKSLEQVIEIAGKMTRDNDKRVIMFELEPWLRAKLICEGFDVTREGSFWVITW